ncbi:major facilitator superfamily domain-containing protein 8-like isoform X2 [Anneissia japonica]|uniref:major facilitator superfamily domain-containing protein 8-like isoform X2 n=1 Tax=Anneissia japonica TaxID=1529436 RepID=UPI00142553FC|nr:major facilitator superfamily domain-containing protein 8-like isoform X2 [Anneissia japonica]
MKEADEKTKLLSGVSNSAGQEKQFLSDKENVKRWRSIHIMYLTMFLSSLGFSMVMPSVWPYLTKIDENATKNFLGFVVASFSLGQLVSSPICGVWGNLRGAREPVAFSLILSIGSNCLYAFLMAIKSHNATYMLIARLLLGFSAGNTAVARSYVSTATSLQERTGAMAAISGFQAVGFIFGPVFQAAFVPIGENGVSSGPLHLNMYTVPAFVNAIMTAVNLLLIILAFKEYDIPDIITDPAKPNVDHNVNELDDIGSLSKANNGTINGNYNQLPPYEDLESSQHGAIVNESISISVDIFMVFIINIIYFVVLFVFSIYETIGTPMTMDMYAWSRPKAVLYNGIIGAVSAFISVTVFALVKPVSKRFGDRLVMLAGIIFLIIGIFVMLPWGPGYMPRPYYALNVSDYNDTIVPGTLGCSWAYSWCDTLKVLPLWQYGLAIFIISFGYPTCQVLSFIIYSKMLGPKPQGLYMGILTAAGSLARTLGPIFVSQIYSSKGNRAAFSVLLGMEVAMLALYLACYKRFIPYQERLKKKKEKASSPLNSPHHNI